MGQQLSDLDEGVHESGSQTNWNESRYMDFWDATAAIGGWFRIGNRPNAGYAEVSAAIHLPDRRVAFMFEKPKISVNTLASGDQRWEVLEPWIASRVQYKGDLLILDDPWLLSNPRIAFETALRVHADIDLVCTSTGLRTVMGADQGHIQRIFLPGQADWHYQHLVHTTGKVRVGEHEWQVNGRGGKDHSWGPRNWLAKTYFRWLVCSVDDLNGFMLVRAVGPTKTTRSGFVLEDGEFHLVDDFEMTNAYASAPNFELMKVQVKIASGARTWSATGVPRSWLPLRHKQSNAGAEDSVLRIVKSPADWTLDGHAGEGICEYHDLVVNGKPVGLHD